MNRSTVYGTTVIARFWASVNKEGPVHPALKTRCWTWTRPGKRYGKLSIRNRSVSAHRCSWEIHYGKIADGLWVLHKCDNPSCVRPSHLFLGTVLDNNRDCSFKMRGAIGEKNVQTKLTPTKAALIKRLYRKGKSGYGLEALAKRFGVVPNAIKNIVTGKSWKYI